MEVIMKYLSTKNMTLLLSLIAAHTPSLVARGNWDPFSSLNQMEKNLWHNMGRIQQHIAQQASLFEQKVEVREEKDKTILLVKLSGFSKDDEIKVKVDKKTRILTITASKMEKREERRKDQASKVESQQSFTYNYQLRAGESDKISTSLKDGLLTVIIPFSAQKEDESIVTIPISYE